MRLIGAFYIPISRGPLHVYVSALPFVPINTLLYRTYFVPDSSLPIILAGHEFEWPPVSALHGHQGSVEHVAFAPSGTQIASWSTNGTIRLWDLETGGVVCEPLRSAGIKVTSLTFSPNGTQLASGWSDGMVRIWNAHTGATVGKPLISGGSSGLCSIAFSVDGNQLATGSEDGVVQLWSVEAAKLDWQVSGYHKDGIDDSASKRQQKMVSSIAFSPSRPWVLSADFRTLRIWNVESGTIIWNFLTGHKSGIRAVQFSPNGTWFTSLTLEDAMLWDTQTHTLVRTVHFPKLFIRSGYPQLSFSPDSTHLILFIEGAELRTCNVHTGAAVSRPLMKPMRYAAESTAIAPDCTRAVTGYANGIVRLWDINQTGKSPNSGDCSSVSLSPNGMHVATGSRDGFSSILGYQVRCCYQQTSEGPRRCS